MGVSLVIIHIFVGFSRMDPPFWGNYPHFRTHTHLKESKIVQFLRSSICTWGSPWVLHQLGMLHGIIGGGMENLKTSSHVIGNRQSWAVVYAGSTRTHSFAKYRAVVKIQHISDDSELFLELQQCHLSVTCHLPMNKEMILESKALQHLVQLTQATWYCRGKPIPPKYPPWSMVHLALWRIFDGCHQTLRIWKWMLIRSSTAYFLGPKTIELSAIDSFASVCWSQMDTSQKSIPTFSGWWFEPLWKILVNWDDYSQYMGK